MNAPDLQHRLATRADLPDLTALMDAARSPKLMSSAPYEAPISYAYHLDAVLLARLLRDTAKERGVVHVEGTVEQVDVDGEGIRAVRLKDGTRHEAEA